MTETQASRLAAGSPQGIRKAPRRNGRSEHLKWRIARRRAAQKIWLAKMWAQIGTAEAQGRSKRETR